MSDAAAAAVHADDHHHYTSTGLPTWKVGFWTFLGSECLFFGALISTYMVYRGRSVTGPLPHGPHGIFNIPLTSISTFVLLMSSLAMVLALDALRKNSRKGALVWIMTTALLGATFLGFQAFEFTEFYHKGASLQQNLFGSTFFVTTGFHGAHVTVGVMWLLALWVETFRGRLTADNSLRLEVAGLYWHFVDIVWIVIFTLVYLIH